MTVRNEQSMESPPIPFALPDLTEGEVEAVSEVLRSNWLTTGPRTKQFEAAFANYVGAPFAVALNSCTAALHLSLEALGVVEGDLVYMSPYTFAATAEVVRYLGAKPVFVDIDPVTLNIDPDLLEKRILEDLSGDEGRPAVIVPVHIAGVPCDMTRIWDLARVHELAVVEDAAHALPASRDEHFVGSMPDDIRGTVCFSFYATKTITTGEGGMLVTNNEALADRARSMSLHGLSRQAWGRYEAGGSWRYDIVAPGYKYNLTDIASALGLVQLDRAVEMRDRRASIAASYETAFANVEALEPPTVPEGVVSAWHLYILRLPVEGDRTRDGLIKHLTERGIGSSVHFIPLHLHSYYVETYGYKPDDFPLTTAEFARVLSLPIYSSMTDVQVERVIAEVKAYMAGAAV